MSYFLLLQHLKAYFTFRQTWYRVCLWVVSRSWSVIILNRLILLVFLNNYFVFWMLESEKFESMFMVFSCRFLSLLLLVCLGDVKFVFCEMISCYIPCLLIRVVIVLTRRSFLHLKFTCSYYVQLRIDILLRTIYGEFSWRICLVNLLVFSLKFCAYPFFFIM